LSLISLCNAIEYDVVKVESTAFGMIVRTEAQANAAFAKAQREVQADRSLIEIPILGLSLGPGPESVGAKYHPPNAVGRAANGLDAETCEQLIALIKRIHEPLLQSPDPHEDPNTRPVYAPKAVVNDAYKEWSGDHSAQPCKDDIVDAEFAHDSCMKTLIPGRKNLHIGVHRLDKRATAPVCIYTTVRCVEPSALMESPNQLLDIIRNQRESLGDTAFWIQSRVFAPAAVAQEAWSRTYPGDVPVNVCRRLPNDVDSSIGSVYAVFREPGCKRGKVMVQGRKRKCRTIKVECL